MRTYSELLKLVTFDERLEYLRLDGSVGKETFGFDRYLNQRFYKSMEWRKIRRDVILRDNGCDLGVPGREIAGRIFIHHMNPIAVRDIVSADELVMDPEYLVCVSFDTHNAIHYGSKKLLLPNMEFSRAVNDTAPWRV